MNEEEENNNIEINYGIMTISNNISMDMNNDNTLKQIETIEKDNNISMEIEDRKGEKIEKSKYLALNFQNNYNLICPVCKSTNIKIEKFEYDKNYDDYKVYFSCNSSIILTNVMLINFLNVTEIEDQ